MNEDPTPDTATSADEFESQAQGKNASLGRELLDLVRANKKWFLIPIILVLLLIGLLLVAGSSALAPFLYPLF